MNADRPDTQGAPAGKLAELLAAEARLEVRVVAARAEADALVAGARVRAEAVAQNLADELRAAAAEHQARHGAELSRRRNELESATTAGLRELQSLTDGHVAQLAEWLVAEVIDPTPAVP